MKQKVYTDSTLMEALTEVIDLYKPKNIFLVAGKESLVSSGAKKVCDSVLGDTNVTYFNEFSSNPSLEEVQKGIAAFKKTQPDIILAIGGGSAIDLAKSINVLASVGSEEISRYVQGSQKIQKRETSLIAVPTTAGSGAEATHFSVVYIEGIKYSLSDKNLLPDIAIIDSTLTHSLSPYQTAVTGLDALAQAIESMWSVKATDESMQYSKESLDLTLKYLPEAVHTPTVEARKKMLLSAHLAGKAINIARTTACHAMSYPLTVRFGIPHGHAVALTLAEVFLFNASISDYNNRHPKGVEYVKEVIREIVRSLNQLDANSAYNFLKDFISSLGVENKLSNFGIEKNDIEKIISEMSLQRAENNPRTFSSEDARRVLDKIF